MFLLGSLAAAIPIVLHFLHREPEPRIKFPAVRLLRHAPVEDARHRKLREWLLLALRVAALGLIALAFARPFLPIGAGSSRRVVIVALDTSMSMSAPGRFARAQRLARDAVSKAAGDDLIGIVTFADSAQIALAPTTDRAIAMTTIDAARPGFAGTRYRAALAAASQAIESAGGSSAAITVVTDLQANGWDAGDRAVIPERASVQVVDAGTPAANFAVTALKVEGARAVATVRNDATTARDAHVKLMTGGTAINEATVTIAPASSADVELQGVRGEAISVSVDDESGIIGDNTRFALTSGARPVMFVVTTSGDIGREAFYLQQALAAAGGDAGLSIESVSTANAWKIGDRAIGPAAVFLLSTRGLELRGRDALAAFVRGGGGLFAASGADVDADVVAQILGVAMPHASGARASAGATSLVPVDERHPVFQAFRDRAAALSLARFTNVAPAPQKDCAVVARFTTGEPALSDCAVGAGRALVFASDLDNGGNDLPLHASFVPFVQESARYLAGTSSAPGDVLIANVPKGVAPVPGIAAIPGVDGRPPRPIAVNVDPAESDSERLTAGQFEAAVARLRDSGRPALRVDASQREDRQHLWQYALLFAIGVLVAESMVSARTA